ncbi:MAG: hypothetical protein ISN26_07145 [Betaproteobacteria bacterium AqS2]|uniref:DUF4398 domain-containing protein n=1 Tax=Candidatus Amphirhobacter heronislandensis TaxID=1732024 RepID=A0A930UJ10_9GAMM|nr:hypothetical protein [Betaproteobacteria bacterium AqS2]
MIYTDFRKAAIAAALLSLSLLAAGCGSNESEEERLAAEEAGLEDAGVMRYSLVFGVERYYRDHIYELRKTRLELRGIKEELQRLNDNLEGASAAN